MSRIVRLALIVLLAVPAAAQSISVRLPETYAGEPLDGRVLVMLSRTERFRPGENGTPIFGVDANGLAAGDAVVVDGTALGHPVRSLADIPAGEYHAQAYLHVYTTFRRADGHVVKLPMDRGEGQSWRRAPGNLRSTPRVVRFDPASDAPVELVLDDVVPPLRPRPDTEWVKRIRIESDLLSTFWGRPMPIGATVLLPRDFDDEPERRYPVVYMQGHFSSRAPMGFGGGRAFDEWWKSDDAPKVLLVTFQHATPYYDDSYGVNSANMGPYGDAIVTELIPEIERRFRGIGEPHARTLTGGSTGGWIAVAMQVFYPDVFGGCWSLFPDQLDFRSYQVVDLLNDDNAYWTEHEWSRVARPGKRDTRGNVEYTMEQENLYEEVIGSRYRSGGQWAAWNATFAPVADDGYPAPLWNPLTGAIDREVAMKARDGYDLRHLLTQNWSELGPKLQGKLHVYVGRMDNYYLEGGVYRLEEFLKTTESPRSDAVFGYGPRGGHGWSPFGRFELVETMADHMEKNAPAKAKKTSNAALERGVLTRLLAAGGVETGELTVHDSGPDGTVYRFDVDAEAAIATWERVRALTKRTGFYPVVCRDENAMLSSLLEFAEGTVGETIAAADRVDPAAWTAARVAAAPGYYGGVELGAVREVARSDGWTVPYDILTGEPAEDVWIALVPTTKPWEALAYLRYGNWNECPAAEVHVAVHRAWHEAYGAEVVCATGDTVEMRVARPPSDREAAAKLARDQFVYSGGDLVFQGYETLNDLTSALIDAPVWFFWWD
ncbi:MAG: DUF4253 domain-containing protein [Planctomycetota bacterium]